MAKKILIVDDEPALVQLLEEHLVGAGYQKDWLVAVFALLGCVGIGSVVKSAPWVLPIVPHRLTDPANPLALEIGLTVGIVAAASVMVRRHRTHSNLERLRRRRRRRWSKRAI